MNLLKFLILSLFLTQFGCFSIMQNKTDNISEYKYSYYPSGNLEYKSEYQNGRLNGITRYWDQQENLISMATYSNGKLHGESISYFLNGNIKYQINYYYGEKDGEEKFYYNNGKLKSITKYEQDKIISGTIRWTKTGKLIQQ